MVQESGGARLDVKAPEQFLLRQAAGMFGDAKRLYRNGSADHGIMGTIDHTHRTAADFLLQLVSSGFGVGGHHWRVVLRVDCLVPEMHNRDEWTQDRT